MTENTALIELVSQRASASTGVQRHLETGPKAMKDLEHINPRADQRVWTVDNTIGMRNVRISLAATDAGCRRQKRSSAKPNTHALHQSAPANRPPLRLPARQPVRGTLGQCELFRPSQSATSHTRMCGQISRHGNEPIQDTTSLIGSRHFVMSTVVLLKMTISLMRASSSQFLADVSWVYPHT